jgi:hypothetical protein
MPSALRARGPRASGDLPIGGAPVDLFPRCLKRYVRCAALTRGRTEALPGVVARSARRPGARRGVGAVAGHASTRARRGAARCRAPRRTRRAIWPSSSSDRARGPSRLRTARGRRCSTLGLGRGRALPADDLLDDSGGERRPGPLSFGRCGFPRSRVKVAPGLAGEGGSANPPHAPGTRADPLKSRFGRDAIAPGS